MPARFIPRSRRSRTMRRNRSTDDRGNKGPDPVLTVGSINPNPTNVSTRFGCKAAALARSSTESRRAL